MTQTDQQNVPKLRFPRFEEAWESRKVSDVFRITRGQVLAVPKMTQKPTDALPYPVYSSQTKNNGLTGYYSEYLFEDAVTWTTDGANAGDVRYRSGKFYCTNVCGVLLSDEGFANQFASESLNRITHKYVSYVGNPKLMNNVMGGIQYHLPTLPEQRKIAGFLGAVDTKIAQLAEKKRLLEDYKKGCMQQIFSQKIRFRDDTGNDFPDWEEKQLEEVAKFSKGKGISKADIAEDGTTPCIRYGEIYTLYREHITNVQSATNVPPASLYLSQSQDVIIPASGEDPLDMARACCVEDPGVALGGDINVLRGATNGVFLAYYLNNAKRKEIASYAQGNSVVHLYASQMRNLNVSMPHPDEQRKIADFLSALDRKINLVGQELTHARTFKQGLLQQMFV